MNVWISPPLREPPFSATIGARMSTGIDKNAHYGNFQAGQDWKSKLGRLMTFKSLDIADDDMNITANKTGVGPLGLIGTALAAGLGPAILAGLMLLKNQPAPAATTTPAPVQLPAAPIPIAPIPAPVTTDGTIVQELLMPDGKTKFLWSLPAKQSPDGTVQTLDGRKWKRSADGSSWEEIHQGV